MSHHEFVLQFGPDSGAGYAANVIDSLAGNGSGVFVPPFGPDRLSELVAPLAGRDLELAGRMSCRTSRARPLTDAAEESGAELFAALFSGKVGDLYQRSLALAGSSGLRLKLKFDLEQKGVPALSSLPWELLFRPGARSFLALSRGSPILRHLDVERPVELAPVRSPLRVLAVLAEPAGLPCLNLARELRQLEQMLSGRRRVEVDVCRPADPAALRAALLDKPYHVLHYMGHGHYDERSGQGSLLFAARHGVIRMVGGPELATALDGFASLSLAVLNACNTARTAPRPASNPFAGVAAALAQIGLPAVIAMQAPIADHLAIAFATELYRRLLRGETVEMAVVEGRHAIHNEEPDTPAWATPALFQRHGEVRLFNVPAAGAGVEVRRRLDRHLARVAEQMQVLVTPPLASLGHAPALTLDQVFTLMRCRPLGTAPSRSPWHPPDLPGAPESAVPPPGRHDALAVDAALSRERFVILVGEAGSGKSAQLRHLAAQLALARRAHQAKSGSEPSTTDPSGREDGEVTPPVPLPVRAEDFAAAKALDPALNLTAFLASSTCPGESGMANDPDTLRETLLDWLEAGEVVVLIDGLDEIGDGLARDDARLQIERFATEWCPLGNRLIVSSRLVGNAGMPQNPWAAWFVLEPFDAGEIRSFHDRWREAVRPQGAAAVLVAVPAAAVPSALDELERWRGTGLLGNPQLLTLACVLLQQGSAGRPCRRVGLYAAGVDALLEQWERRERAHGGLPLPRQDVFSILTELAAGAHERHAAADARRLRSQLARRFPTQDTDRLCHSLIEQSGFLSPLGHDALRFHPASLMDYFTARSLAADPGKAGSRLLERSVDPRWRQPILLAMGILGEELDDTDLRNLLLAMLVRASSMEPLLPVDPLCLAAGLAEMERIPAGVAEAVTNRLLAAYAESGRVDCPPVLRLPVERAFRALLSGPAAPAVERVLAGALDMPCGGEADRAPVVASLLWRLEHFNPDLAERIAVAVARDSPAWGWPIGAALRSIAARCPEMLADPPSSLRRTLSRRPDLVERVLADPACLALILALYGGFAPGQGFAPERIYRESLLTPMLLSALEASKPARCLVPALWHEWRTRERDGRAADALIALAALGEPVAAELRRSDPAAARAANRIAEISHLLAAALQEVDRAALDALRALAGQCAAERWCDLAGTVLETASTGGGLPLQLLALESAAAPEARQPLFSEVWHVPFAGPEPVYNFAVLLDVAGEPLSDPPEVLAASLAGAADAVLARWSRTKGWPLEPPAWPPSGPAEVLEAALDALTVLADPFDFVRGWALARLAPLLAEHGLTAEAAVLAAGSVSDRFATRARALHALLGAGAGALERSDPESALLELVRETADDALRLRGYLQLVRYFPNLRLGLLGGRHPTIPTLVAALSDPSERASALMKLADLDAGGRDHWIGLACTSARRIADPEDRTRTLCRLAARVSERQGRRLARLAVRTAAFIADARRRSKTLAALRETLPADRVVRARLTSEAERLEDPWEKSRAMGTLAPRLWTHAREIAGPAGDGTPLLLAAIWTDQTTARPRGRDMPRPQPLRATTPGQGLELSALTVPGLLADLENEDDLARARAALALHGDRSDAQRNLSATAAGRRTLEILAAAWIDARDTRPRIAQVIGWAMERVRHDDGGAIAAWTGRLGEGGPGAEVAELLLSRIHDLHPRVWPEICAALRRSPAPVQRALLRSVCFLLARRRLPDDRWQEIQRILAGWDLGAVGTDEVDLELPASLVAAAEAGQTVLSRQAGAVDEAVAAAERSLAASGCRLVDALQEVAENRRQTLAAVGALRVAPAARRRRLAAAAARIAQSPRCLDILLPWLAARLGRDVQDRSLFRTVVSDLLGLVAEVAECEPELFRRRAENLPHLGRRLREAVELHDTHDGRRDALRLLAHLRLVTPDSIAALRSALRDVTEVQAEALRHAGGYRVAGPEALAQLSSMLRDPSAVAACAAARTLTALVAANRLPAEARGVIAGTVVAALREPASRRRVHHLVMVRKQLQLESRLRLDEELASLLVELAGFRDDPPGSEPDPAAGRR